MTMDEWKHEVLTTCPGSERQLRKLREFLDEEMNEESLPVTQYIETDHYGIIPYTRTVTYDSRGHRIYVIKSKYMGKEMEFEMLNDDPGNIEQSIYEFIRRN